MEEPSHASPLKIQPQNSGIGAEKSESRIASAHSELQGGSWRGELTERLKVYRTRKRSPCGCDMQSQFSFEGPREENETNASIAIEEAPGSRKDNFSFTIAIGRSSKAKISEDLPMEIDVSSQPETGGQPQTQLSHAGATSPPGLYPVASIDDRRLAAVIDFFCLLFAYGGFLGLFGSLGGHFTFSKLSAAVCVSTFAAVYLQYFALFTIFGGTTPGMMMRSLQVVSFSGEQPVPKQMLLRSLGYMLSAGTFFLGFLWALWDCDELTWHDRLSRTYLSTEQTLPDLEGSDAAHSR